MESASLIGGSAGGIPGLARAGAAIVVIGRNEGERLRTSLASAVGRGVPVIYVDSGSRDGSPGLARSLGCEVVDLDSSKPLSAARARNEGFEAALRLKPAPEWIQFLDGDCELAPDWLASAIEEIRRRPEVAILCGQLAERNPGASVYNRLCQLEWDRPPGEVSECGGIMLIRAEAFRKVGGFNALMVAGEDPELCLRVRRAGWKIYRLASEMAVHDAAITRFSQWWTRSVRAGHAYAQAAALHGNSPERYRVRECASIRTWALWIPLLIAALAVPTLGWSLAAIALYPLQALRIAGRERRRGVAWNGAILYGLSCVAAKFPQLQGQVRYWRPGRRDPAIIEYKGLKAGTP